MKANLFAAIVLCAAACLAADETPADILGDRQPAFAADAAAPAVLAACRSMLPPRPVQLEGRIVKRNRRGTVQGEYRYVLEMRRNEKPAKLCVTLKSKDGAKDLQKATILRDGAAAPKLELEDLATGQKTTPALDGQVLGTDVTWLDLTLDFLWWTDVSFEAEREGETVHGQKCVVIVVKPSAELGKVTGVRLWADRKTGCMMQAEQLGEGGKTIHRLWGTRIKKFDGRWSVSVIETESPGSGLRTKITVEAIKDPDKPKA